MSHLSPHGKAYTINMRASKPMVQNHVDPETKKLTKPDPSEQPHYHQAGSSASQNYGVNNLTKSVGTTTGTTKSGVASGFVSIPVPDTEITPVYNM